MEILEAICFNCNQFFPTIMDEPTEFGICLNDQAFEPFIDELLENPKTASCQELIHCKKFSGLVNRKHVTILKRWKGRMEKMGSSLPLTHERQ